MNSKRSGVVLEMDHERCLGLIIDENGQDIQFRLDMVSGHISINAKVIFDIALTAQGLSAINVEVEKVNIPTCCM